VNRRSPPVDEEIGTEFTRDGYDAVRLAIEGSAEQIGEFSLRVIGCE
jgi:hypothetical protein